LQIFEEKNPLFSFCYTNFKTLIFRVWPFWLAPAFIVATLVSLLHLLDRQVELTSR
jgi:hypothetical protein